METAEHFIEINRGRPRTRSRYARVDPDTAVLAAVHRFFTRRGRAHPRVESAMSGKTLFLHKFALAHGDLKTALRVSAEKYVPVNGDVLDCRRSNWVRVRRLGGHRYVTSGSTFRVPREKIRSRTGKFLPADPVEREDREKVGENLRALRDEGLTLREIAERTQLSLSHVFRHLRGVLPPNRTRERLLAAGIPTADGLVHGNPRYPGRPRADP